MNFLKETRGISYLSILMALIVIEVIALAMLSSISTTNQATEHASRMTVATRIAQSCMENAIYETMLDFEAPLDEGTLKCDQRKGYVPDVKSEVYSDGATTYPELRLITVEITFSLSSLSGKGSSESLTLKRLVAKDE